MRRNTHLAPWLAVLAWLTPLLAQETVAPPAPATAPATLESLWEAMADEVPLAGYRAAWAFGARGDEAVAFAREHLSLAEPDAQAIAAALAGLNDDVYAKRQAAFETLAAIGAPAEGAMRAALAGELPEETRARVEALLERIANPAGTPEGRRAMRLVRALAVVDTDASRALLADMAARSPAAAEAAQQALPTTAPATQPGRVSYRVLAWPCVVLQPEPVERILALSRPCEVGGDGYAAFRCDGESLLAALRPHLDDEALLVTEPSWISDTHANPRGEWAFSTIVNTFIAPAEGGGEGRPVGCMARGDGRGRLQVPRSGPARLRLDVQQLECHFDLHGPVPLEAEQSLQLDTPIEPGQAVCLLRDLGTYGPYRVQHLVVVQVLAVPRAIGNPFEVAIPHDSRRWIALGQEGLTKLIREGQAWNRAAARMEHEPDERWTRALPGGAQVRIVGVRRPGRHPYQWWDASGRPIAGDAGGFSGYVEDADPVEAWYQARNADGRWGNATYGTTLQGNSPTLTIGVGDGEWQQAGVLTPGGAVEIGGRRCELSEVTQVSPKGLFDRGLVRVEMQTTGTADVEVTVGAVTHKGTLVVEDRLEPQSQRWEEDRDVHAYVHLPVSLDDVKEYVLLTRPRHWTTFEGIAAEPAELPPGLEEQADQGAD